MSDGEGTDGWFVGTTSFPSEQAIENYRTGSADVPKRWPTIAVSAGHFADQSEYYRALHQTAIAATREAVSEHAAASDVQVIHKVRAADDLGRVANELAERVIAWGAETNVEFEPTLAGVLELADESTHRNSHAGVYELADTISTLHDQQSALHTAIENEMQSLAPNLSAIAGELLGARLIALAGGLKNLARSTSGTVQVLGAEDALFAHLRNGSPPPKHGIIFTHEYVRGTSPSQRGSAARALAGKLTIAARIDYYSGERNTTIERELAERIETIRERES